MKTIPLTQGKTALVDDEDYDRLSKFKWHYQPGKRTGYAVRNFRVGPRNLDKKVQIQMHNEILSVAKGRRVDHRDGDGLNNQRCNLRAATNIQNQHNSRKHKNGVTSRFKGVSRAQKRDAWVARITIDGKIKYLGYFKDDCDAARAYDKAAIEHFGEFAKVNGANINHNTKEVRIVFATDLPLCECCNEPWCPIHLKHYADCECVGPHNAEELGYRLVKKDKILYGVKP